MTGKCANIGEKNEKKSSEQLSCTDVETLRAGIIVERLVTVPFKSFPPPRHTKLHSAHHPSMFYHVHGVFVLIP